MGRPGSSVGKSIGSGCEADHCTEVFGAPTFRPRACDTSPTRHFAKLKKHLPFFLSFGEIGDVVVHSPLSSEKILSPKMAEATMGSSSSILQDLLRDHSSEIGNWSEIVNNHQDETATAESFSADIDHDGPFYIFATNLPIDSACDNDNANMEMYRFFGGHKHLYAVHVYQNRFHGAPQSCMLMARNFECCVQILMMDGKATDSKEVRLEYVLPSTDPPKTVHFTALKLEEQLLSYRNIHPLEEKRRPDPFGGAKPIDAAGKLQSVEKKLREESIEQRQKAEQPEHQNVRILEKTVSEEVQINRSIGPDLHKKPISKPVVPLRPCSDHQKNENPIHSILTKKVASRSNLSGCSKRHSPEKSSSVAARENTSVQTPEKCSSVSAPEKFSSIAAGENAFDLPQEKSSSDIAPEKSYAKSASVAASDKSSAPVKSSSLSATSKPFSATAVNNGHQQQQSKSEELVKQLASGKSGKKKPNKGGKKKKQEKNTIANTNKFDALLDKKGDRNYSICL
uniref:Cyclin-like domain-containing protein n=1 Tax=Globodera rostochiensis TaxID=31243 RepID=A0A914GRC1_GLORO